MIGILCEKASAARNFAKALGGTTGTYNGEQYVIAHSHGHLYGFNKNPAKQVDDDLAKKYSDWSVKNLPWNETDIKWRYSKIDSKDKTNEDIVKAFNGCDEICIATDDDPTGEGELLAWEIIFINKINAGKYTRMYFEDESPVSIQKAFRNRKLLGTDIRCMVHDGDYKQAVFRAKWDYLSMQFTRAATRINSTRDQVLRNGRLKSAINVVVGNQLMAIKNYVKTPFFENRFKDENGVVYINKEEERYKSKEAVPHSFTESPVELDSKTIKHTAPPKFLDLATLSATLAQKGIKAETVLATYQKMYEDNVVSYPRTEDHYITEEQFKQLLPLVNKIADVVNVDHKYLTHLEPRKTHIKTGMAHGANRPGTNVPLSLDTLDDKYGNGAKEIYEILARNYLATVCEDYEYEQQKGHVVKYPKFIGTANVPKSLGWKNVYQTDDEEDKDENEVNAGLGKIAKPFIYEGANPKPTRPTMKWLMKQLEKRNVGTGATRTSTYAEITNPKSGWPLLSEKKGVISLTDCGVANYNLLQGTHIGDLSITEHVYDEMKQIKEGKLKSSVALHEIQQLVVDDIKTMTENNQKHPNPKASDDAFVIKKKPKATGDWQGKQITINKTWGEYTFSNEELKKLFDGESIVIDYKGHKVKGFLKEQTYKGKKFVGFAQILPDSNSVPDSWCGHTFTDTEKEKLKAGEEVTADDFYSQKKQKHYSTSVKWMKVKGYYKIVPSFSKDYKKNSK